MTTTATRRGCGTFLAYLLHRALGELPCIPCYRARFPGGLLREGLPCGPPGPSGAQRNRAMLEEAS